MSTESTVNRGSLKWHPKHINLGADPAFKTIYHKMGPLLIALKPLVRDGKEVLNVTINDGKSKFPTSQYVLVADLLKECGVE